MAQYPYIPAYWRTVVRSTRKINLVCLHAMQAPEKGTTATSVAEYFRRGCPDANGRRRPASAHVCVDGGDQETATVQCVRLNDVAYGAPSINHDGFHIEQAGYSEQTAQEWDDPYSDLVIIRAAKVAAEVVVRYNLPARFQVAQELRAGGARGITTHLEASKAFKPGGHWDPGPNYPVGRFMRILREQIEEFTAGNREYRLR